jgi:hypothetical protein
MEKQIEGGQRKRVLPEQLRLREEMQEAGGELRLVERQRFKCGSCGSVYVDHYPVDDGCAVCHQGLVRLTGEPVTKHPFGPHDQSAEWKDAIKSEGASEATGKKPAYDGRVVHERIKNLSAEVQKRVSFSPVERQPAQLKKPAVARPLPTRELGKG